MPGMQFPSRVPRRKPGKQIGTRPLLPSRTALHQLARGPAGPAAGGSSAGAFAAATPSGLAGMDQNYQALTDMGQTPDDTAGG
jgi:hypothetical protein